jgi:hypothetical protein
MNCHDRNSGKDKAIMTKIWNSIPGFTPVNGLLQRKGGATLQQIMDATGWQARTPGAGATPRRFLLLLNNLPGR